MVQLTLAPLKGNHARRFPHQGHLGLSPVKLTGTVQTAIEEDGAQLQASSIDVRVRCYEAEWTTGGKALDFSKARTVYQVSQRLWSATEGEEAHHHQQQQQPVYKPLGNFKSTWKLVIPPNAIQHGARSSATYTRWRIWWVLEAGQLVFLSRLPQHTHLTHSCTHTNTVVQHEPKRFHGSHLLRHYHLHLLSHATPPTPRSLHWSNTLDPSASSASPSSSGTAPLFTYQARLDSDTYSPGQPFHLVLDLQRTQVDPKLNIKKVVVELRRELLTTPTSPLSLSDSEGPATPEEHHHDAPVVDGYFSKSSASSSSHQDTAAPMVTPTPARRPSDPREEVVSILTLSNSSIAFNAAQQARASFNAAIPRRKTEHHWSLGETSSTPHLSVRFFVVVQVRLFSPILWFLLLLTLVWARIHTHTQVHVKSRTNAVIELPTRDVTMQSVSAEDRAAACQGVQQQQQQHQASREATRPATAGGWVSHDPASATSDLLLSRRRSSDQTQPRKRFAAEPTPTPPLGLASPGSPTSASSSSSSSSASSSSSLASSSASPLPSWSSSPSSSPPSQLAFGSTALPDRNSTFPGLKGSKAQTEDRRSLHQRHSALLAGPAATPDYSHFSFASPSSSTAAATAVYAAPHDSDKASTASASTLSTSPPMRLVQKLRGKSKERTSGGSGSGSASAVVAEPHTALKLAPFHFFRRSSRTHISAASEPVQ